MTDSTPLQYLESLDIHSLLSVQAFLRTSDSLGEARAILEHRIEEEVSTYTGALMSEAEAAEDARRYNHM